MSALAKLQLLLGTSEAYKSLFKAGFVLIASAVIAAGQLGGDLYSKDMEAHKIRFEAEYAIKQPVSEKTDCSALGQNEVICRLAKHHASTLGTTLEMWSKYISLTLVLGLFLMVIGALGFLMPLFAPPGAKPHPAKSGSRDF